MCTVRFLRRVAGFTLCVRARSLMSQERLLGQLLLPQIESRGDKKMLTGQLLLEIYQAFHWMQTPGQTQDMLERSSLVAGLRMSLKRSRNPGMKIEKSGLIFTRTNRRQMEQRLNE